MHQQLIARRNVNAMLKNLMLAKLGLSFQIINNYKFIEMAMLSSRMSDYPSITQGKTRIPGVNDGEEFEITNVS